MTSTVEITPVVTAVEITPVVTATVVPPYVMTLTDRGSKEQSAAQQQDELGAAAAKGNTKGVLTLLEIGADVNGTRFGADTPLHMAAYRSHPGTVNALLKAGADVDMEVFGPYNGATPLYSAAAKAISSMTVLALLRHGRMAPTSTSPDLAVRRHGRFSARNQSFRF